MQSSVKILIGTYPLKHSRAFTNRPLWSKIIEHIAMGTNISNILNYLHIVIKGDQLFDVELCSNLRFYSIILDGFEQM